MFYLIVPPIIIIVAIAVLIVFLGYVLPTDDDSDKLQQNKKKKQKFKLDKRLKKTRTSVKKKFKVVANKGKNKLDGDGKVNGNLTTQGIVSGNNTGKHVVSLRKKSMVSDKIEDGENRDTEEITFMKEIESDPQNSKKYEKLADYYMEHEKFKDARECYKYVLRLDPRHKRAQVAMRNLDRIL